MNFSEAKRKFDDEYRSSVKNLDTSLCTVDGKFIKNIKLYDVSGNPNEEYYKWQFIYSLVGSELIPKEYIGTEIYFPKGNIGSQPIKIDAVVFDRLDWIDDYKLYRENKDQDALQRLRNSAVMLVEFKRDGNTKKIESIFNSQIKATIKETDKENAIGIYYDKGRLYIFKKTGGDITRLDNSKNFLTSQRLLERLQLELPDPYYMIPSFTQLLKLGSEVKSIDVSNRKIEDLDIVYEINNENIKQSLSKILKRLDSLSLTNEAGYLILIQMLAIKIFDEKQAGQHGTPLDFYIKEEEYAFKTLDENSVQDFIQRIDNIYKEAKKYYKNILGEKKINYKVMRDVQVAAEIVMQLQNYSFMKSRKSDLYQLVFYNFATKFKKEENAQFLTPLAIINFIVNLMNPKRHESICDPCCGIGDFLSLSYVNSDGKLDDRNLYGFDNDYNMTILAQLNMLLNGDGNACIKYVPNKGSIDKKLTDEKEIVDLIPGIHHAGNWDEWKSDVNLMKYDLILTNPPFGKGRSLDLSNSIDSEAAKFYETYDLYIKENPKSGLDLGVVFLENTVRSLKENGRFAIILSNSIASNKSFEFVRKWLLDKVRIVALLDLPENIFAETGVNTTIIIGYKPSQDELNKLKESNYKIFTRDIKNVGYEKKTSNRNVFFDKVYKLDFESFETVLDDDGDSILDEDFTDIIKEFKEWCLFQEIALKSKFLD